LLIIGPLSGKLTIKRGRSAILMLSITESGNSATVKVELFDGGNCVKWRFDEDWKMKC